MSLVSSILNEMSSLTTPQRKFLVSLLTALSCFVGRATRTNLHRYGAPSPRTQSRWTHRVDRKMDWVDFNLRLVDHSVGHDRLQAAVLDCSFLSKSGKHTYGLGHFWDGSQERAHRGLEVSLLGLLEADGERAWALSAVQTPAELGTLETRTPHYLKHLRRERHRLPSHIRHLVVDALYANQAFIWGVRDLDLHVVTKLRKDANLRYLYEGPYAGRGRKRQYEGKVDYEDWSRWEKVNEVAEGYEGYTAVVNHPHLALELRVVVVFPCGKPEKRRVLMSTDVELTGWQVIELYAARFQIEYLFRDGKQFAGLADGQMRDQAGLDFHLNASLAALNLMRAEHLLHHDTDVISIASIKRRHYNDALLRRLFSKLDLDPTSEKFKPLLDELRNFGAIAA